MRLKWGKTEYKGILISVDSYMNLQLDNTVEFVDGESKGSLGEIMIRLVESSLCLVNNLTTMSRCNNVLWVNDASTFEGDESMKDE